MMDCRNDQSDLNDSNELRSRLVNTFVVDHEFEAVLLTVATVRTASSHLNKLLNGQRTRSRVPRNINDQVIPYAAAIVTLAPCSFPLIAVLYTRGGSDVAITGTFPVERKSYQRGSRSAGCLLL